MKNLKEMSLREKESLLKGIIREYQKAHLQLELLNQKEFYPQMRYDVIREGRSGYNNVEISMIDYIEKKKDLETIIEYVDGVLQSLPASQYEIIENEYLLPTRKEWWQQFYSRSTYYRVKRKAIDDVLFYLIK